jgi:ribose transport system substrate-binding protein
MKQLKPTCLVLPLLMTAAFATQARADGETIAVFTKNQTNPYFQTVRVGANIAAKTLNAKTLHYIPTKPDSIPEQLSQIEDVVVEKPNAIVFIPGRIRSSRTDRFGRRQDRRGGGCE